MSKPPGNNPVCFDEASHRAAPGHLSSAFLMPRTMEPTLPPSRVLKSMPTWDWQRRMQPPPSKFHYPGMRRPGSST